MTNEQHNKYAAIAFFVYGGFQALMTALMMAMFILMLSIEPSRPGGPEPPFAIFGFMMAFMVIFQAVFTVPGVVAGWAMWKKKSWARTAAIVGGVVSALSVPFGTAACVYAMWFFFGENWKEVYGVPGGQTAPPPPPKELQYGAETSQWDASYDPHTGAYIHRDPPDWR